MTNEKLCTLIQEGQKEYLPDLWNQTKRFGAAQARTFFLSLGNLGGVELEDLLQSCWIALIQAVRYFNAEKGSFLTFYGYTLKNAFREAAGLRSSKRNPLCDCLSLDTPADSDSDDTTLLDFVADPIDPMPGAARKRISGTAPRSTGTGTVPAFPRQGKAYPAAVLSAHELPADCTAGGHPLGDHPTAGRIFVSKVTLQLLCSSSAQFPILGH